MGILDNIKDKFKPEETINFDTLAQEVVLQSEETLTDGQRMYRFKKYINSLEKDLAENSMFKIAYYNSSILGTEAVAFIDSEDYDKYGDNGIPLYIVSPLFVYSPLIKQMIYMRKGDTEDISGLLNYQLDYKMTIVNEDDDVNTKNIKTVMKDFNNIILPLILETMTDSDDQDKELARKSVLGLESDKVKTLVKTAQELEGFEDELVNRKLQYEDDSIEFQQKVEKFNKQVLAFYKKVEDVDNAIEDLHEQELILKDQYKNVTRLKEVLGDVPEHFLIDIDREIETIAKQYKASIISGIKEALYEGNIKELDFNQISNQILKEFREDIAKSELDHTEIYEMTLDCFTTDINEMAEEIEDIVEKDIFNFEITSYHQAIFSKAINLLKAGYTKFGAKSKADEPVLEAINEYLGKLVERKDIKILKQSSQLGCYIFAMELNNKINFYLISPILFGNISNSQYYSGFPTNSEYERNSEYADREFFSNMIKYLDAHYLKRLEKPKVVTKEESADSTWAKKIENVKNNLTKNPMIAESYSKLGIKLDIGTTKMKLSSTEIYSGSIIKISGNSHNIFIIDGYLMAQDSSKLNRVKFNSIAELSELLEKSIAFTQGMISKSHKFNDKQLHQIIYSPICSGLDLRTKSN